MQDRSIDRTTLLNITIFVEAFILLTATIWTRLSDIELVPHLAFAPNYFFLGAACGAALALASFTALWMGKTIGVFSDLRTITYEHVAPIFSSLQPLDLILVAAMSGFCEEIFFRGTMQHEIGIWATSAVFALFHCPSFRFVSYGLWVFTAGLFLGWLYLVIGNLWVPIFAHAISNLISLFFLRYGIKQKSEQ